jgi:hypothetical protein
MFVACLVIVGQDDDTRVRKQRGVLFAPLSGAHREVVAA